MGTISANSILSRTGTLNNGWTRITFKGKTAYVSSKNIKAITITKKNDKVYITGSVNVRSGYTADSKKLGSLKKGDRVSRTGTVSNGWSRINYKGKVGYVSSKYLSSKQIILKPTPTKKPTPTPVKSTVPVEQFTRYNSDLIAVVCVNGQLETLKDTVTYLNNKYGLKLKWNKECEDKARNIALGKVPKENGIKESDFKATKEYTINEIADSCYMWGDFEKYNYTGYALVRIEYTDYWNNHKYRYVCVVK